MKGFNNSKNWTTKNKSEFKKADSVFGNFVALKDGYAVITGKDWSTSKKVSRGKAAAWLLVGFTPVGKAAKGAKILGKGIKRQDPHGSAGKYMYYQTVTF